jgi:hypothetical protein
LRSSLVLFLAVALPPFLPSWTAAGFFFAMGLIMPYAQRYARPY